MYRWVIAIVSVAVLATVAGGAYWYGSSTADEPVLAVSASDSTSEGIKVHGDWEVTVSDPDTGEKMVYEFSNDLAPQSGAAFLALALRGEGLSTASPDGSHWMGITFYNDSSSYYDGTICTVWGNEAETSLLHSGDAEHTSYLQTTGLQIKGTCTVGPGDTQLGRVATVLAFHPSKAPSISPKDPKNIIDLLTQKYLDDPIPVAPGQLLSATVKITFV